MGSDEMDPGLVSGIYISIHAPRGGNDTPLRVHGRIQQYFNPRSPHGERHIRESSFLPERKFQSTLPAWGATQLFQRSSITDRFQSTLPAWGATLALSVTGGGSWYFNPRSPHGERL